MVRRLVLTLSLGAALLPGRVFAQGDVAVRVIDARSHVVHTLVAKSDELPVGRCTGNCTLRVKPGGGYAFRLALLDGGAQLTGLILLFNDISKRSESGIGSVTVAPLHARGTTGLALTGSF